LRGVNVGAAGKPGEEQGAGIEPEMT
jgi:hypothetical protein